ncbi:hypothetical protein Hypma_005592 [Hypsizygus marmoreus]|uniref:Uncharacterized protein n=1 Tax=Hypsizygus marmoreus TaxID=39966 RepID=A0A369JZE4_HYPMA|nr:hypothetical protein Hypma_005592 [Hypsizygus marmoreus]
MVSFTTRIEVPASAAQTVKASPTKSSGKLFNAMASPSFKQQKSKALNMHYFKGVLSVNDTVPIYDAQTTQLNLPEDATNIDKVLEEYEGLIQPISVILVPYTVSNYFNKLNNIHNLQ